MGILFKSKTDINVPTVFFHDKDRNVNNYFPYIVDRIVSQDLDGGVIDCSFSLDLMEVSRWVRDRCKGDAYLNCRDIDKLTKDNTFYRRNTRERVWSIHFEFEEDALLFKLTWI